MPRKDAYVAKLTPTHTQRIVDLLNIIRDNEKLPHNERRAIVLDIKMILHHESLRKSIGPKVKNVTW